MEQPNFVARKGLSSLIGCYFVSFTIIAIVGFSAPTPIQTKVYRDVDYGAVEISGTSLTIDKVNGDALWDLKIHDLNSEKQFVFINAKVQRPGWNTVSGHQMDFSYQQEYTLFSQQGTSSHFE